MTITVFLGSTDGTPRLQKAAVELGEWIAEHHHHLVYGGSSTGLMGILARTVMEHGGTVTGVELEYLAQGRISQNNLSEMIVAKTMGERKRIMLERGDVFLAFPGGAGTLEEISEAISHTRLGIQEGKCIFFNLDGYYDPMVTMLDRMVEYEMLGQKDRDAVLFVSSLEELDAAIN